MNMVGQEKYIELINDISNMIYSLLSSSLKGDEYEKAKCYIKTKSNKFMNVLIKNGYEKEKIQKDIKERICLLEQTILEETYNEVLLNAVSFYKNNSDNNEYLNLCLSFLEEKGCISSTDDRYRFIEMFNYNLNEGIDFNEI